MMFASGFVFAAPGGEPVVPAGCPWSQTRYARVHPVSKNDAAIDVEFECSNAAPLRIGSQIQLLGVNSVSWSVAASNLAEFPDPCAAGGRPTFRLIATGKAPAVSSIPADGTAQCLGARAQDVAKNARRLGTLFNMNQPALAAEKVKEKPTKATIPVPLALENGESTPCSDGQDPNCYGAKIAAAKDSFDVIVKDGFDLGQIRLCDSEGACSYNALSPTAEGRIELLFEDPANGIYEPEWGTVCMASKSSLFTTGDNAFPILASGFAKVACRQLGFEDAAYATWRQTWNTAVFGPGAGPVWAYVGPPGAGNLYCRGDESSLSMCGTLTKEAGTSAPDAPVTAALFQISTGTRAAFVIQEFSKSNSIWFAPSSVILLDTFVQMRMAISNLYTARTTYIKDIKDAVAADTSDVMFAQAGQHQTFTASALPITGATTLFSSFISGTAYQDEARLMEVAETQCKEGSVICAAVLTTRIRVGDDPDDPDAYVLAMKAGKTLFGVRFDHAVAKQHVPDSFVSVHKDCSGAGAEMIKYGVGGDGFLSPTHHYAHLCKSDNEPGKSGTWYCGRGQTMYTDKPPQGGDAQRFRADPILLDVGIHLLKWMTVIDYKDVSKFPTRASAKLAANADANNPYLEKICECDNTCTAGETCTNVKSKPPDFGYIEYLLWYSSGVSVDRSDPKFLKFNVTNAKPLGCMAQPFVEPHFSNGISGKETHFARFCPLRDPAGVVSVPDFAAEELLADTTLEERLLKVPSNPLILKKAGLQEVIDEQAYLAWRGAALADELVTHRPTLSTAQKAELAMKAKPITAKYYDPKLSGMTLESWSCHHPNDLVLSCSDGAGSDADKRHLPPSTPPPPSPVAPPPAPCADNFCRLRKFYAEHNPLEYVVWSALVNIAYYEWWYPDSAWMLEPAKKLLNFASGLLSLTPTLAGVFDKVVARTKVGV